MLSINFKYQGKKKPFIEKKAIKTDWSELTFADLLSLFENAKIEDEQSRIVANLMVLSEMSEKEIAQLNEEHIDAVRPWIGFVDSVEALMVEELPQTVSQINIGAEAWGKFEAAKQLIQAVQDDSIMPALPDVIKVYVDIDILPMSLPKAYPIAIYFIHQLRDFQAKYVRLNDYKPKAKDLAAGVEKLNQYGFFTTLHALSKGDPLKYDAMLLQPADNVYQTLVMDFELSEIRNKYQENEERERKIK